MVTSISLHNKQIVNANAATQQIREIMFPAAKKCLFYFLLAVHSTIINDLFNIN